MAGMASGESGRERYAKSNSYVANSLSVSNRELIATDQGNKSRVTGKSKGRNSVDNSLMGIAEM
jgi:hypothetical protein